MVENGKLSGVVEEVPDKTVGRKVSAGEKGGHGGGEDEGLGMGKEVGVDMGPKLEGRKWNEDADNESLFCY